MQSAHTPVWVNVTNLRLNMIYVQFPVNSKLWCYHSYHLLPCIAVTQIACEAVAVITRASLHSAAALDLSKTSGITTLVNDPLWRKSCSSRDNCEYRSIGGRNDAWHTVDPCSTVETTRSCVRISNDVKFVTKVMQNPVLPLFARKKNGGPVGEPAYHLAYTVIYHVRWRVTL